MVINLTDIANPKIHRLFAYWKDRCDGERLMTRDAINPLELRDVLANLFLVEVGPQPTDLRFLIAGSEMEDRYGRSLRGTPVSTTFGLVSRRDTSHQWSETATDRKPRYRCGPMGFPNEDVFIAERLMLPLSADGTRVDHIFGAVFYASLKRSAFEATAIVGIVQG
jgi:hypothetical protein